MKNKPKQIKSFSVDGDVYLWLVERLKETGEKEFNVSTLVNNHLNGLHVLLKSILEYYDKHDLSVDRAWVINKFFRTWGEIPVHESMIKDEATELFLDYHREQRNLEKKRGKEALSGFCFQCKNETYQIIDNGFGERRYSFCDLLGVEVNSEDGCGQFEFKEGIKEVRGNCYQCSYEVNGYCSIYKRTVGYVERCNRFKVKDGIESDEVESVVQYGGTKGNNQNKDK